MKPIISNAWCLIGLHRWKVEYFSENTCQSKQICQQCGKERTDLEVHTWQDWRVDASDIRSQYINELQGLRKALVNYFSEEELRTLCFALGVEYESMPGRSKPDKCREIVTYFLNRKQVQKLSRIVWKERSELDDIKFFVNFSPDKAGEVVQGMDVDSISLDEMAQITCYQTKTCTRCGKTQSREEHNWSQPEYLSAYSCTTAIRCLTCGKRQINNVVSHKWGPQNYDSPQSCILVQYCLRCKEKKSSLLPKHQWGDWKRDLNNRCLYIQACQRCRKKETEHRHEWGEWQRRGLKATRSCRKCNQKETGGAKILKTVQGLRKLV